MAMNPADAIFTNGRFELPAHARGVLVLADPPEAGWRIESVSDDGPTATACEQTAASTAGLRRENTDTQ
jgi:hypothetical protein